MKKLISLATALAMAMCGFSLSASANDMSDTVFDYGNGVEVTVSGNFSYEKKQTIADSLVGENKQEASARNILCIFGHKLETSYSNIVVHNVYTESPKCVVYQYEIVACSRSSCDHIESQELISTYRTGSCHG